jgi:SAM-dependent methyltransferase
MDKRSLYYMLSPSLRRIARRLYYLPVDTYEYLTGKRDDITPPKGKIFIGSGNFSMQGERLLKILIEHGGLQPNHRVLDVGCGIGRLAIPLSKYLSANGSYEGFDIVKYGVDWCRKKITPRYPNFNFMHIDLRNELYNLGTISEAKDFAFPYIDKEFDLVFLFSVFTHMIPADVENYLKQIRRVLKSGGVCIASFFIFNSDSDILSSQNNGLKFSHNYGNHLLLNPRVKEANVAFREEYLLQIVQENGFAVKGKHYGYWPGRSNRNCIDFQDILVLEAL